MDRPEKEETTKKEETGKITDFKLGRHKRGRESREVDEDKEDVGPKISKLTGSSEQSVAAQSSSSSPAASKSSTTSSSLSADAKPWNPASSSSGNTLPPPSPPPPSPTPSPSPSPSPSPKPKPPPPLPPVQLLKEAQLGPFSHLVIALTHQKGWMKLLKEDPGSVSDGVKPHGLYGNGIGGVYPTATATFLPNFNNIPSARELTMRLMNSWKELKKKTGCTSVEDHFESTWKKKFEKHCLEVFMTQEVYFKWTMDVFDIISPMVNRALKESCRMFSIDYQQPGYPSLLSSYPSLPGGPYCRDGRKILDVVCFEDLCKNVGLPIPTLHVRKFQVSILNGSGSFQVQIEQELIDLKFYIEPSLNSSSLSLGGEFIECECELIPCPQMRSPQVRRSQNITPGSRDLHPYDPSFPLFLV